MDIALIELTSELYEGLDLCAEIRTTRARNLGVTALLWNGDSHVAGFAICHWGPTSEAGEASLFVKFGAVRCESGAERRFASLLDACGELAASVGMQRVLAGVNQAREEAYRDKLQRGFRTQMQGVAMHRPNESLAIAGRECLFWTIGDRGEAGRIRIGAIAPIWLCLS